MNNKPHPSKIVPTSHFERWVYLLGRMCILFALAYVPLIFYTTTWHHYNPPKAASMQFLSMILIACWATTAMGRRFVSSALATPAAFFAMIIMLTTLKAVNLGESIETVYFILACLFAMVLVPKFFTRLKDFEVMTYILGMLCIVADIYALAQWYNWSWFFDFSAHYFDLHKYTEKPVSFFGNENYLADFMNMALPICLTMIFCHWRKPSQMIFFTGVTILNFITMLYVDCNASYAGFFFSIPIIFAFLIYYRAIPLAVQYGFTSLPRLAFEKRVRAVLMVSILLVSIGGTIIASVPNPVRFKLNTIANWIDVDGDNQLDGVAPVVFRLQCMAATVRKIIDVPITGIGAGNFKVIHPLYESQLERRVLGEETLARKVHNDHLYHAVEYGMFGIFGFYWLVALAMFVCILSLRAIRKIELAKESSASSTLSSSLSLYEKDFYFYLQLGVMAGLLTAIISTAFSQTFVIASSAAVYWLLTGFATAAYQSIHRSVDNRKKPDYGTTSQPLNSVQQVTRHVPAPFRFIILLPIILVLGSYNSIQIIGESWLKLGMNIQDVKTYVEPGGREDMPNKFELMFRCFDNAMKRYPYQMEIFYILGRYYIDGISIIDMSLEEDSRGGNTGLQKLNYLGLKGYDDQYRNQLISEGIVALQTDIYLNPNYKWAHNNLGVLYDKFYNFSYSNRAYDRVFAIDYEQVFAHYNMGIGFLRHDDVDRSIQSFETSLFVDPTKNEVNQHLAQTYVMKKEFKIALAAADRYVFTDLRNKLQTLRSKFSLEELSPLIQALNEFDLITALDEAKKFINLNDVTTYRLYLSIANNMLFEDVNDLQPALEATYKAERIVTVPPDPEIYALYGSLYYKMNDFESSAKNFEEYLRQNPNEMSIRRQLTLVYSEMQDHQNALRIFQPVMSAESISINDIVTYYRLLITNGYSWEQVFPIIKMAIEQYGKAVIDPHIIGTDLNAPWASLFLDDPRMRELVGPDYERFFSKPEVTETTEPVNSMPDAYELPVEPVIEEDPGSIQPGDTTTIDRGSVDN